MDNLSFTALVVAETKNGEFQREIKTCQIDDLPHGDVVVKVSYSSLNYKDALSATGNRGVTRKYPHTPGIDASGVVEHSLSNQFKKGDEVIVTSYDLGMNTPGGFGQYIRVPEGWVVKLPKNLSLKEGMVLGTAGFTAGMSIYKMVQTILPEHGDILVTGATGGVGSIACGILSHLGYSVTGVSGKTDSELLKSLGVNEIISRQTFLEKTKPALLPEKWAGVIDTVGGDILATAIKSSRMDGIITCCGNVASFDLPINVFPFILRGVSLLGIDSQHCPMPIRSEIWEKLASVWKFPELQNMYDEIGLDQLEDKIAQILKGQLKGRTIVDMK